MAEIRVGYFLEDIGQENFLTSLVARVAQQIGLPAQVVHHEIRNATGGRGTVLSELGRFLRDVRRERDRPYDLLVVAIDGNCHGYQERREEIRTFVARSQYPGLVVYAVPDPHIERWYLADPHGFQQALETAIVPQVPAYKCERGRYKQALRDAIRQTGIIAPLGGAEYGSDIASALDLYTVGKADTGFKHFIEELQEGVSSLMGSER
ncbi:MAG: DUF4276 family protein [Anaerolineae bacterium]|nr:DUF4276 family protein [Anaerolineae bacterium]